MDGISSGLARAMLPVSTEIAFYASVGWVPQIVHI